MKSIISYLTAMVVLLLVGCEALDGPSAQARRMEADPDYSFENAAQRAKAYRPVEIKDDQQLQGVEVRPVQIPLD